MLRSKRSIEKKLVKATEYLKSIGCREIILFGSLSDGTFDRFSDIDLAVSGISPRSYFRAVASLPSLIGWKVDLVTMDYVSKELMKRIRNQWKILYAAKTDERKARSRGFIPLGGAVKAPLRGCNRTNHKLYELKMCNQGKN